MFEAASNGRLFASWDSANYTIAQVIRRDLTVLRARSRREVMNNDYAKRMVQLVRNNVVGEAGFRLHSLTGSATGKPNKAARASIERNFKAWCRPGNCVLDTTQSMIDLQLQVVGLLVTDGEAFVYETSDSEGYKVQLIDPVLIDVDYNEPTKNIRFGIEYNDNGRPVAYWMTESYKDTSEFGYVAGVATPRIRLDASHVRHIFIREFVGQERGIPWLATSLTRLHNLSKFEDAALIAGRIGASKLGFFHSETGGQFKGNQSTGTITAEPGTFQNIGNMQFTAFDPAYPGEMYDPFVSRALKGVSSGMNVDYHSIGNDMSSVNYSSARVAMLETREYWKTIQRLLIEHLMTPVFEAWLYDRMANEGIVGVPPSKDFSRTCLHEFVGRRWEWVDPLKEVQAKQKAVELGITSFSAIIMEQGQDPEEVYEQRRMDRELAEEYGETSPTPQEYAPDDESEQTPSGDSPPQSDD
ncbi:phage portal protein [Ferrimonas balearica]|uniref:phage portal protein n=1 Tax=Ferrimonas balearica TaxID=44012 RepID=UPI0021BD8E93|nr:phage portal protein [Ferrimonas balearica]